MRKNTKNNTREWEQISLSDVIALTSSLSSAELAETINLLLEQQQQLQKKEEEEERKRQEEERKRLALEEQQRKDAHIQEVTSMDLPLSWENAFDTDSRTQGVHAESISDGLILSLNNVGCVDIEYIASVTGEDYKTVITALKGSIYQNPDRWNECFYKGWETADDYLSGNLMRKWQAAKKANEEYKGYFEDNLRAIEKVLPPTVATKDIYVTLGSPWVPTDIIDDFIAHLFKRKCVVLYDNEDLNAVKHDEITGTWEIPDKNRYYHNVTATKTYGTDRMEALYILEKTLNMKTVVVTDKIPCITNQSGEKRVINKDETVLAIEKQQKMIAEFQKWVWQDEKRKERLETIFENQFSSVRRRVFDGSFLTFPTLSPTVELYPYQKNAVARILFSPNTLLAHDVGSGKTYVMIAAGMELRRMGLSKKNLYVVPNNIVGQWKSIFLQMYPAAKLLCVEPRNFTPSKRGEVLRQIKENDYDGIIMAYSCFEQIPLSKRYYLKELEKSKKEIYKLAAQRNKATSRLESKRKAIAKALAELVVAMDNSIDTVYFDQLGITRLFVDEAHNFKNVPIETKVDKVLGVSAHGSKKCQDMMDKVHMIQKQNGGGGVVMATGTPITNSITDAFVMQQYLQSGELTMLDLQSFDSWIGMFAERVTEFEIDVDTSNYRLATRFAKFHNLPELTAMLSSIADFHQVDESAGLPEFDGYSDALVGKTASFEQYLHDISVRVDAVRKGIVSRMDDNMLKITTDGRKAALDLRLVDPAATLTYQSKVVRCTEIVWDIHEQTAEQRCTQLIFCDTSTPKAGFNLYDEIKRLLLNYGIPEEEIAYIHDATTESKREKLFGKMRRGEIRVLIGSTFKLGLGVNVQDKLVAVHHLDVPWRPADMTQREGRILRQGNKNEKVRIYRYITEGSFDAYSWQLLETKQRFITGLLSGSLTERSGSDIEDTVLNYAEVKALAVGNPLVKERVETANELARYLTLQQKTVENRIRLEKEQLELPGRMAHQRALIKKAEEDAAHYAAYKKAQPIPINTAQKEAEAERRRRIREQLHTAVQQNVLSPTETQLMDYAGFQIILPANMLTEKPFVWLQRQGRYYVELGETAVGDLIRIDNFLDGFHLHQKKLTDDLQMLEERQQTICAELAKNESYVDQIKSYEKKLAALDKKLGVDTK